MSRGPKSKCQYQFSCKNLINICSSCNMGTTDLPEIYTLALGLRPRVRVYISGKSLVPMLQLIYSTWVNHLQVYMETAGMLCECIYMGQCDFRLWVTS